ncbi:MAG: nucleoside triphosphate pyrophosphohydrolase [Nitrospirae bacterium]|nr:nucleoside triphosphate pyrophosphohydrolase [Nitrospirota bacterium]
MPMNFEDLVNIAAKLRAPEGCPWDREQTRETLKPFLVEELYELIDAFDDNDTRGIKEELGDLLFQIVLQSQLAKEEGQFDVHDVVDGIARKMVRRHPHVFGDTSLKTSQEVLVKWQEHKKNEGKVYGSAVAGVPRALPALLRASRIQMKATKVGFDWDKIEDVFAKLDEELGELKEALNKKRADEIEDELGDIFFVLVRIANFVNVNSEDALRKAINKFTRRFAHIEREAARQGRKLHDMTLAEMELLWNEAKKNSG